MFSAEQAACAIEKVAQNLIKLAKEAAHSARQTSGASLIPLLGARSTSKAPFVCLLMHALCWAVTESDLNHCTSH